MRPVLRQECNVCHRYDDAYGREAKPWERLPWAAQRRNVLTQ